MSELVQALLPQALAFGLVAIRCLAVAMLVPVLGGEAIPITLRGAVASVIALTLTPLVPAPEAHDVVSLLLAGAGELLVGLAMGIAVRLLLLVGEVAGEIAGLQIGFSFSRLVDPTTGENTDVVTRLLGTLATLAFIGVGGPRIVLGSLARSFESIPLGTALSRSPAFAAQLLPMLGASFTTGLRMATPVVVALLLTNLAIALLARAAPQLNLFVFGFGVTVAVGTWVLASSAAPSMDLLSAELRAIPDRLVLLLGG
jgi:flagellar biosynthesis protein FliR